MISIEDMIRDCTRAQIEDRLRDEVARNARLEDRIIQLAKERDAARAAARRSLEEMRVMVDGFLFRLQEEPGR